MEKLKNYMEIVAEHKLNEVLNYMNICKCDKCKLDMMAIALNELPPKYVVTDMGELYTKVSELANQFEVDAETALIKAAMFVGKNPKHGPLTEDEKPKD